MLTCLCSIRDINNIARVIFDKSILTIGIVLIVFGPLGGAKNSADS